MAEFSSGALAIVIINGLDISGFLTSANMSRKAKDERHELLGDAGIATIVHQPTPTLDMDGLLTPEIQAVLPANFGPGKPIVTFEYGPQGNAAGSLRRTGNARVTMYDETTKGDGTALFKGQLGIEGLLVDDNY